MSAFATFGVGLAARPIGGMIFGSMGDRIGRRKTLMVTIVGIGAITGSRDAIPGLGEVVRDEGRDVRFVVNNQDAVTQRGSVSIFGPTNTLFPDAGKRPRIARTILVAGYLPE